jgi:hypothetical protein
MTGVALGLGLALGASVALNGAFLLQHAGSSVVPAITPRHPLATLRSLLGSRLWLAGAVLGMTGWAMHVGALSHAPLSLVQAFVAGGLVLAVPMATVCLGHRLDRGERRAVVLLAASLALISLGLGQPPAKATFAPGPLAGYLTGAAALAAGLVQQGSTEKVRSRVGSAAALGLAGGILYGAADMAIKAVTTVAASGGVGAAARSPWLAAATALTLTAFFAFQRGLQVGRAVPVIALMTAGTNVVSILGGLLVLGDPLGRTPVLEAAHVAGFLLVLASAWRLAPVQAALQAPAEDHAVAS